jgi:hypothetical protein
MAFDYIVLFVLYLEGWYSFHNCIGYLVVGSNEQREMPGACIWDLVLNWGLLRNRSKRVGSADWWYPRITFSSIE